MAGDVRLPMATPPKRWKLPRAHADVTDAVFDRIDAIRDLRNNQYLGLEPSLDDVRSALPAMERMVPELMSKITSR